MEQFRPIFGRSSSERNLPFRSIYVQLGNKFCAQTQLFAFCIVIEGQVASNLRIAKKLINHND